MFPAARTYVSECDEAVEALALHFVRVRNHRRLGDGRVLDERRLDLGRAQQVSGHVQHVVDATRDPQVPVRVPLRAWGWGGGGTVGSNNVNRGREESSSPGNTTRDKTLPLSDFAESRERWKRLKREHHKLPV